jgi:transcriptional regulator with XRE-family HTH domain
MKKNFLAVRRYEMGLTRVQMAEKWEKMGGKAKSETTLYQYENFVRYINVSELRDLQKAYDMTDEELLKFIDLCREVKNEK